jgi:hypothetical protein
MVVSRRTAMADKKGKYTPMPQVPPELFPKYEAVVGVLSGTMTVSEAARQLGTPRNHFQTVMHRGLEGLIEGLKPRPSGRPSMPERERELLEENERLREENAHLRERTETTDRLLEVASGFLKGRVQASGRSPRTKAAKAAKTATEDPPEAIVEGARQMRAIGLTAKLAAAVVGKSPSTLRRWTARRRDGHMARGTPGPLRGRSVNRELESRVEDLVRRTHGLSGAESLSRAVVGISRRVAATIKARTVTAIERERRQARASVVITQSGVVRGFDQLWVPTSTGLRPVLVSADACVPYRTSLVAADRYDSRAVARALERDFRNNGAPLVWRADRASCHRTAEVDEVLRRWGVLRLHGPAHLARYYGQLERQNREHRGWLAACSVTSGAELDEVIECMRRALNDDWRRRSLGWMTASEKWAERVAPCDDRAALAASVVEHADHLRAERRRGDHDDELLVERLAVERALTERGYLRQQPGGWC